MEAYLIGAAIGAIVGAGAILWIFDNRNLQKAAEEQVGDEIWRGLVLMAMAENARLRLALAEGQMTEDDKKIVAMTVAAIEAAFAAAKKATQAALRSKERLKEMAGDG